VAKVLAIDLKDRLTFDIADSWQARVLMGSAGKLNAVVLSVLAHNYDDALLPLLQVVFPGFTSITAPFYCSAAKVTKAGRIVANLVQRDGTIMKDAEVFMGEMVMQHEFRALADNLKLSDRDRVELFAAVQKWVVADRRLDPAMDPKDPDAKRLVN
jgi:hypothetical protein